MEKTAVVTGASRGIGAAVAGALARSGWRVAVCCEKNRERAEAVCASITAEGGTALPFCADVSDEAQVTALFDAVRGALGEPSALVCSAGIAHWGLFTDMTAAEWDRLFAVNVRGAFLCCRAALPAMIRAKHGRIVLVSSMWGQVGASCEAAYSATKAALIGLTQALAQEEGPSGVTVNCIAPGVIETDMMAGFSAEDKAALCEDTPVGRLGTPEDVANAAAFLCSDAASFITGQVLGVNGGFIV